MEERRPEPEDDDRPELARLPAGRHGLSREFVARNHRERLILGLGIAVAERGYDATTVADITRAAGVSRRTFYKYFKNKQDCFLAGTAVVSDRLLELAADATDPDDPWADQFRDGLAALLLFFEESPELARLCLVEPLSAGGEITAAYRAALHRFVRVIREGRPPRSDGRAVPESVDDAVVGGVASFLASRVSVGESDQLMTLLPDLLRFALTPYLGAAEAQRLAEPPTT